MRRQLTAAEAQRDLLDLLRRVHEHGEIFDVVDGGEVVATIMPPPAPRRATAADLIRALESGGSPDAAFADDLEQIQREQPTIADEPTET